MARVELVDVTKVYDNKVTAVNTVNLVIEDREFVVLVGPSGCGKSTLLRMIAGLEEVTSGDIFIGGQRVNDVPPKDRDIAMVFQNYALYPHMTVFENMAFGLKIRKLPREEIDRRVREAARILGLEGLLSRKPRELSGGQRQRVAVGRAIVRKPKVFLFDEPLSNLDAKLRVKMRAELARIHRELHATSVYVTHDQVEAMTLGDQIVLLRDGEIQQVDTPLRLYHQPRNLFVAGFIGSPSMNFLKGRVEGGRFVHPDFDLDLPESIRKRLSGGEVILGLRPEHLILAPDGPIRAVVEFEETLGSEILLHVRLPHGDPLVVRIPPEDPPKTGDAVSFRAEIHRAHFFDPRTEENLTYEGSREETPAL